MNWIAALDILAAGGAITHDDLRLWQAEGCCRLRLRDDQPPLVFQDPYEALETLVDVLGVRQAAAAVSAARYRALFPIGSSLEWRVSRAGLGAPLPAGAQRSGPSGHVEHRPGSARG